MNVDNIFDRIRYIIEIECNNVLAQFSKKTDIGDQTVRNIVKYERSYPGYEVITKILQTFYWVNPDWFLLGRGEYRRATTSITEVTPEFLLKRYEELAIENNKLREENSRLRYEKKGDIASMVAEPNPKLK